MSMKRCGNGHYFDPAKHESCPYCGVQAADSSRTVPAAAAAGLPDMKKPETPDKPVGMDKPAAPQKAPEPVQFEKAPLNIPRDMSADDGKTVAEKKAQTPSPFPSPPPPAPGPAPRFTGASEGETVALIRRKTGIDPVTGWLICVEGPDKGRDYRIRNEKNFIGRSERMDIYIAGDDSISRDNHAMISFNPRKLSTKLYPGEGRGIVYLNGDELEVPTELKAYDLIEMGQSKFLFIPFCGEKFKWE